MRFTSRLFFIALIISFFVSCQKENGKDDNTSKSPYYFTATINGTNVKYEADDLTSPYGCGISQPESLSGFDNNDIYEGTVIANMTDFSKSNVYVHILKFFTDYPDNNQRSSMIKIGSYGYGRSETSPSTVNGASIDYTDANGNYWTSENGPQTGSTFNITELINNNDGTSAKIFKAAPGKWRR